MKNQRWQFGVIVLVFLAALPGISCVFYVGATPLECEQAYNYSMTITKIVFSLLNIFPLLLVVGELVSDKTRDCLLKCKQNSMGKQFGLMYIVMALLIIAMMTIVGGIYRDYISLLLHMKTLIEMLIIMWTCNAFCVLFAGLSRNVFMVVVLNTLYALVFCLMHIPQTDIINIYAIGNDEGLIWGLKVFFNVAAGMISIVCARRFYR